MKHLFQHFSGRGRAGQVLVFVAGGMVVFVGAVGLTLDVGMALVNNRNSQNGADAAAHAGAIVLVRKMSSPGTQQDAGVLSAITQAVDENGVVFENAWYRDFRGNALSPDVKVGAAPGGTIPAGAQGVEVRSRQVHQTLFARALGVPEIAAAANATAVGGPVSNPCDGVDACALLPITFPTTVVTCNGQNKSAPAQPPSAWKSDTNYVIPLCGLNPGSLGWIDWDPPPAANSPERTRTDPQPGGTAELVSEICSPNPPPLALPDWYYVTNTGNTNSKDVEDCLNKYAGQYILMPMFDDTCNVKPVGGVACSNDARGVDQWYHFPEYAVFELAAPKGAYINGNNRAVCDPASQSNATSCLVGRFVNAMAGGEVGQFVPGSSPSSLFAVQLIK